MSKFRLQSGDPIVEAKVTPDVITVHRFIETVNALPDSEWRLSTPVMLDQGGDSEHLIDNQWYYVVGIDAFPESGTLVFDCWLGTFRSAELGIASVVMEFDRITSRHGPSVGGWELHVKDPTGQQLQVGSVRLRHGVLLLKGLV